MAVPHQNGDSSLVPEDGNAARLLRLVGRLDGQAPADVPARRGRPPRSDERVLVNAVVVLVVLVVLADSAPRDRDVRACGMRAGGLLGASRRGGPQAPDGGTAGRQVFQALRSQAVERWKSPFTPLLALSGQLPPRGLLATQRCVVGAVVVSQLTVLDRFRAGRPLQAA